MRNARGWGPRGGRRRPPWWPENEEWPPRDAEAWRQLRRGFIRRAGAFAVGMLLLLTALAVSLIWLIGTLVGSRHPLAIVAGGAVVLVVLLVARGIVRGVRLSAAPIGELIEASARVEAGQFGTQVPERGPGEVRALARAFNAMSSRLAHTEEQRRRLLAEVSHELRTPLTVIQGNVEAMLDGLYPMDRPHLERIQAETRHLEQLIDDLRTLSLAEAGALRLHREPTDLAQVARDAVAGFEAQAGAAGVRVSVAAPAAVPELDLDPQRIHQVIANLVSNALRHTPAGGEVTVSVAAEPARVTLSVTDTGSGMSADAVDHAFERFWRSGTSAGAGLGLAIVRDLVAVHGGDVTLLSAPGAGTTVTVAFPRSRG